MEYGKGKKSVEGDACEEVVGVGLGASCCLH